MDAHALPAEFVQLAAWLESLSTDRRQTESESFGDRLIEFDIDGLGVRLVRDRGQWAIEIGGEAVGGWYDTGIWESYLMGSPPPMGAMTTKQQADLVRAHLQAMRDAVQRDPSLPAALSTLGWNRNRSLLGLPPAPPPR